MWVNEIGVALFATLHSQGAHVPADAAQNIGQEELGLNHEPKVHRHEEQRVRGM